MTKNSIYSKKMGGGVFILLITFIFLSPFSFLTAQQFCETPATSRNINQLREAQTLPLNSKHYCIRVYFHIIPPASGSPNLLDENTVNNALQILNDDFAPYNISFVMDSEIDYISEPMVECYYLTEGTPAVFSVNNHNDGIDIYLYSSAACSPLGKANGIGSSGELLLQGSMFNQLLANSHAISHEMGHVFGLYHTHQGYNFEEDGGYQGPCDRGPCRELVDGSNSKCCGDYIEDTPADPLILYDVNPVNCTWNQYGNVFDPNNEPYDPDTHNIMAYTLFDCMDYFTPLQGNRMRNVIETVDFLQEVLITNNCNWCQDDDFPDLVIRDSELDLGFEPNNISENTWSSPDIWIRNSNDNGTEHQNPKYENGVTNYVYVRITNKNCAEFQGSGKLKVYWTKANLGSEWDASWTGQIYYPENGDPVLVGDILAEIDLPDIGANEEVIIPIEWTDIPNPEDYASISVDEPFHFCLLARIDSDSDPMTYEESTNIGYNIRSNNNIASKNVTIIAVEDKKQAAGSVMIYNPYNSNSTFDIHFNAESESGKSIFEVAEVYLKLHETIYNRWVAGGEQGEYIGISSFSYDNIPLLQIKDDKAKLKNIQLNPKEISVLALRFNFLIKEISEKEEFTLHASQVEKSKNETISGNSFVVKKPNRPIFSVSPIDKNADRNQSVTLTVDDINEDAVYNWYDEDDNLIYSGKSMTTIADMSKKYRIEVIAENDGFKDYSEVNLNLKPHRLTGLTPNPASNTVTATYSLNAPQSAYIVITGYVGNDTGVSRNYIINTSSTEKEIDLSSYAAGYYSVGLVCDGELIETQNLIKQ